MTLALRRGAMAAVLIASIIAAFTALRQLSQSEQSFEGCSSCDARNGNAAALRAKRAEPIALRVEDPAHD